MPMPQRLVGVGRADAAPGRSDLELAEPPLARLVDREVPRHDHVRVARDVHASRGREPARLELVELLEEHARVDDAAGADHARSCRVTTPLGICADLVRLVADDDRVPCVRAALIAAHEIRVLREQVDDLALAFVSPLRPDDDGRWHLRKCRADAGLRASLLYGPEPSPVIAPTAAPASAGAAEELRAMPIRFTTLSLTAAPAETVLRG